MPVREDCRAHEISCDDLYLLPWRTRIHTTALGFPFSCHAEPRLSRTESAHRGVFATATRRQHAEHAKQAATKPASGPKQPVHTLQQYVSLFSLLRGESCCMAPRARVRRKKKAYFNSDPDRAKTFLT